MIEPARPDQIPRALELAFQEHPREQYPSLLANTLRQLRENRALLSGLLAARDAAGKLEGVIWTLEMPGRTSVTGLPQLSPEASSDVAAELLHASQEWLADRHIAFDQIVLDQAQHATWKSRLAAAGVATIVELDFFERDLSIPPNAACQPDERAPLQWQTVTNPHDPSLRELLAETHIDSLDCPAIAGRQTDEEMLEGYAATGDSGCRWWRLATRSDQPLGCCLLSYHASSGLLEVVYLGVAAAGRRQGVGRWMLQQVPQIAIEASATTLVAAVDRQNPPAQALYRQAGFQPRERRFAHLRLISNKRT